MTSVGSKNLFGEGGSSLQDLKSVCTPWWQLWEAPCDQMPNCAGGQGGRPTAKRNSKKTYSFGLIRDEAGMKIPEGGRCSRIIEMPAFPAILLPFHPNSSQGKALKC